jgi:hypothetical protein
VVAVGIDVDVAGQTCRAALANEWIGGSSVRSSRCAGSAGGRGVGGRCSGAGVRDSVPLPRAVRLTAARSSADRGRTDRGRSELGAKRTEIGRRRRGCRGRCRPGRWRPRDPMPLPTGVIAGTEGVAESRCGQQRAEARAKPCAPHMLRACTGEPNCHTHETLPPLWGEQLSR